MAKKKAVAKKGQASKTKVAAAPDVAADIGTAVVEVAATNDEVVPDPLPETVPTLVSEVLIDDETAKIDQTISIAMQVEESIESSAIKEIPASQNEASVPPSSSSSSSSSAPQYSKTSKRKNYSSKTPTVSDIIADPITQLAVDHWAQKPEGMGQYDAQLVIDVFEKELFPMNSSRLQLLEMSGYLENYLWPYFDASAVSLEHKLSILLIINEKYRSGLVAFESLAADADKCTTFCSSLIDCLLLAYKSPKDSTHKTKHLLLENSAMMVEYVTFMINIFRSLENPIIRQCTLRYLSMPIWSHLSTARRQLELSLNPPIAQRWLKYSDQRKSVECEAEVTDSSEAPKSTNKRSRKSQQSASAAPPAAAAVRDTTAAAAAMERDANWLPTLLEIFLYKITNFSQFDSSSDPHEMQFISRFLELSVDLLSQLPTRRFLKVLLQDIHFVPACTRSPALDFSLHNIYSSTAAEAAIAPDDTIVEPNRRVETDYHHLWSQLVAAVDDYLNFEIDDKTGLALTSQSVMEVAHERVSELQQVAYKDFPEKLRDLVFSSVGEVAKEVNLRRHLQLLEPPELVHIAKALLVITDADLCSPSAFSTVAAELEATPSATVVLRGPLSVRYWLDLSDESLLRDLIVTHIVPRARQIDALNMTPLYPNEKTLWNLHQLPVNLQYTGREVLALPKLNVQFLTMHDYLLRNFTLFGLESAFEIREDIMDAVKRMGPKQGARGDTTFLGWARMALPIFAFSIDEVSRPLLGNLVPHHVDCTVTIDISRFSGEMKKEWEDLREYDVVFLVCIERPKVDPSALASSQRDREKDLLAHGKKPSRKREAAAAMRAEEVAQFARQYGVKYVRGGVVFEMRDEANVVLNDQSRPDERSTGRVGNKRRLRLHLDAAQYYQDMKEGSSCYDRLNLIVRRKPKENNFKAILETIRDLINTSSVGRAIPDWLHDVFLGYGNPLAAHYTTLTAATSVEENNYTDTFIDAQHILESFPTAKEIVFQSEESDNSEFPRLSINKKGGGIVTLGSSSSNPVVVKANNEMINKVSQVPPPPYRLQIVRSSTSADGDTTATAASDKKRKRTKKDSSSGNSSNSSSSSEDDIEKIIVTATRKLNPGPYPEDAAPSNRIRFTPTQVEAVRSGINPGLTVVVGPPGTGKTDVAVQIITTLYHNYPQQKLLIVAHSNAALNDLFEKIMERDVAPRHLLRLGSGESELREALAAGGAKGGGRGRGEAFSKTGRVNWSLMRRLQLLAQVQRLAQSVGVPGDIGASCETAEYFHLAHVRSRIEKFHLDLQKAINASNGSSERIDIAALFPFSVYFADVAASLFSSSNSSSDGWQSDYEAACGCFRHINRIFEELRDYRAFELLRTQHLRSDFLLTKQARIVAMTCTHAAMTRSKLVDLGFKYDSIVMEEAAQILEVETLIPMLLQDTDPVDGSRLKRVVLIGDHHQLPPVVKHQALQRFSRLEQSMFTRFIRLGIPSVQLDRQGRARSDIAALYKWRYQQQQHQQQEPAKTTTTTAEDTAVTLGDLPNVLSAAEYTTANAGFLHTFQFVDVPDFQGKGEICPTAYFFQNLGEAEYVVAVYQYMRLLGYPAEKISILTTYNGQKHLIRDILTQRCMNPIFGMPAAVATVDKFQGQQNDFILLSMVRTEHVGHIRDIRRLVVALSRARLGLYIFGRQQLYSNCYELATAFGMLLERPTKLQLIAGEAFPSTRLAAATTTVNSSSGSDVGSSAIDSSLVHEVQGVTEMGVLVYQMVQQAQSLAAR